MSASLREELAPWRDSTRFPGPDDYVIPTVSGRKQSASNLRRDVLPPTADLLGQEDVRFTLNAYAQSGLDPDEMLPPVRAAFDQALEWAQMGARDVLVVPEAVEASVS